MSFRATVPARPRPRFQSARNATIGSTRNARRAGMSAASNATPVTTDSTTMNTSGSRGDVWNSRGAKPPTGEKRDHRSRRAAEDGRANTASDDHPHHVRTARAECDAHAELSRALRDVICENAIQPHRREHERQRAKHGEHRRAEPP